MKKSWLSLAIIATLVLAIAGLAVAAEVSLKVPYVKKAPNLDGKLTDEAWTTAAQKGGKGILEYHLNGKPAPKDLRSEVLVCWDDDNLYVAYKNFQDEKTIIADITNDGGATWTGDDDVEFFIHTMFPATAWKQFVSNPNGIRSVTTDGWEVAAEIYKDHWIVEAAISFDVFDEWPDKGDEWAANFSRHLGNYNGAGDVEWLTWSPLVKSTFLDATTLCLLEFVK
jgi:hypothetical protein